MSHYIHHVPGRLRVKTMVIKRNDREAERLHHLLASLPGVRAREVNTVTGSILISYDAGVTHADNILTFLREHSFLVFNSALIRSQSARRRIGASVGETVGKAVVGVVVEKLVERSAMALIGAML